MRIQLRRMLVAAALTAGMATCLVGSGPMEACGCDFGFCAPPVDGIVAAVKAEDRIAVIDIGDAKVEPGYRFIIYRGKRAIAKAEVVKVKDDLAGVRILFTIKGETVRVGDKATTSI
jgi:hypothetical protein